MTCTRNLDSISSLNDPLIELGRDGVTPEEEEVASMAEKTEAEKAAEEAEERERRLERGAPREGLAEGPEGESVNTP